MKTLYLFLSLLLNAVLIANAQNASVQFIHNAADPALQTIDLYFVETQSGNNNILLFEDDLSFRAATAYNPISAGVPFDVIIADSNSSSIADSIRKFSFPGGFSNNTLYSVIASGVLNPSSFDPNPNGASTALDLFVYQPSRAQAAMANNVEILSFNGTTDLPSVDLDIRDLPGVEVSNLSYGNFSNGYFSFPPQDITIDLYQSPLVNIIDSFSATLSIAGGAAITVFSSGFVDSTQGAEYGLFAALPVDVGGTYVIPLPKLTPINQPTPPDVSIRGDSVICPGKQTTLIADASGGTGFYSYNWSNGESTSIITVSPLTTKSYSVTVDDNNFTESATKIITVLNTNPPCAPLSVSLNATVDKICEGDQTQLQATATGGTGNYTYNWSPNTSLSCFNCADPFTSPINTTDFSVTVTDGNTSASDIARVTVYPSTANCDSILSAPALNKIKSLKLFPNPSNGIVNLSITVEKIDQFNYRVYSSQGKLLLESEKTSLQSIFTEQVDLSQLSTGIYFMQMNFGKAVVTKKLLISN